MENQYSASVFCICLCLFRFLRVKSFLMPPMTSTFTPNLLQFMAAISSLVNGFSVHPNL